MSNPQHSVDRPAANAQTPAVHELLAFDVASTHYALPIACVRGVVRLPPVTEVPRSPERVLGVIKVRGQVTTLIDLRRLLRLPHAPPLATARVLLVEHGSEVLGLLVDAVLRIHRLKHDEIEPASVLGSDAPIYLTGIGRVQAPMPPPGGIRGTASRGSAIGLLLLLDPDRLLGTQ